MSETNSFHDRLSSATSSATSSTTSSATFRFDEEFAAVDPLNDIPIPWRVCDVERGAQVEDVDPRGLVP